MLPYTSPASFPSTIDLADLESLHASPFLTGMSDDVVAEINERLDEVDARRNADDEYEQFYQEEEAFSAWMSEGFRVHADNAA